MDRYLAISIAITGTTVVMSALLFLTRVFRKEQRLKWINNWLACEENFIIDQRSRLVSLIEDMERNAVPEDSALYSHVKMLAKMHNTRVRRCMFAYIDKNEGLYKSRTFRSMQKLLDCSIEFGLSLTESPNRCIECIDGSFICSRLSSEKCKWMNSFDCWSSPVYSGKYGCGNPLAIKEVMRGH